MNKVFFAILFSFISTAALAQVSGIPRPSLNRAPIPADSLSYLTPKDYIIGDVTISGAKYLDKEVLLQISKLNKGDKINLPGEQNANVIKDLYKQGLFDDVQLNVLRINMDTIYLEIADENYQVRYPEVMNISDRDINGIRNLLDVKRITKEHEAYMQRIADRITELLGIQTDQEPYDFLAQLLRDYNYLTSR